MQSHDAAPVFNPKMKQDTKTLWLVGPNGDREKWTIIAGPLKGKLGLTDWVNRTVTINSRLRNAQQILDTALHEIVHVTAGQNGSEYLAVNVEGNYSKVRTVISKLL